VSKFKGSIPIPEYDTGDIVKLKGYDVFDVITDIKITWNAKFPPEVKYYVNRDWYAADKIEYELEKKASAGNE
jgi:hypothetical protein